MDLGVLMLHAHLPYRHLKAPGRISHNPLHLQPLYWRNTGEGSLS
jgi:hypothetical protein